MADDGRRIEEDRREAGGGAAGSDRPKARSLKPLAILWPYAKRRPATMATVAVFLLAGAAIALAIPYMLGGAVDSGFGRGLGERELLDTIDANFLPIVVAAIAMGAISAIRFYVVSRFGERIAADLRNDLYARLLTLSPRFHMKMRSGEAVSRLTADVSLIETFLGSSASLGVRTLLNTLGAFIMMFVINWRFGLLLVGILAVALLPVMLVGRVIRRLSTETQSKLSDAGAEAAEALDAVELVQAYGREPQRYGAFNRAVEATFQAAMARNRVRAVMIVLVSILFFGGVVGILWLGARTVTTGGMSPGEFASMVLYASFAGSGIGMLAEVYGEVMRAAGAADRASEVFAHEPEIEAPAAAIALPRPSKGALAFDQVTFAYNDHDAPALDHFSLDVAPGEFVALVGPSGAGKSTVFRLALRLFDPNAGHVRLDGISATDCDPADWRARFAYAPQESTLFTGTARDNIAFGADGATDAALIDAARRSEAWGFLDEKGGLGAPLGSKGRALSGGQRQRVALARALVRDAPVLLLDEATSALDSESEALVQKALEAAASGRTTLAIAHRLSTIRKADRIVVMDEGRVVEEGTHDALVAKGGLYARLAEIQFEPA
ncbi:MAG: ABC transporter transmembrane domain-containing protein [Pseudomonadota bacterium]